MASSSFRTCPALRHWQGRFLLAASALLGVFALPNGRAQQAHVSYTTGTAIDTTSTNQAPLSVAVDGSGNVYFLGSGGLYKGTNNAGSYTFSNLSTVSNGAQVAVDKNGVVYLSLNLNGATASSAQPWLYRLTPSGSSYTFTPLAVASQVQPGGLAVDPAGNAFVVQQTSSGGSATVLEFPAGSTSSTTLVTLNTIVTNFTVDSSSNLFWTYVGQDGTVNEIAKTGGAYSLSNQTTPITALCHSTGCSLTGLTADAAGNVYGSFVNGSTGGTERYLAKGSNTFTPSYLTLSSELPRAIAVGATGTVYTATGRADSITTRVPPAAINFGSQSLTSPYRVGTTGTVTFLLDASTVYGSITAANQGGIGEFGTYTGVSCGDSNCTAGTTYPAGTLIGVGVEYDANAVGTRVGALNLNSSTGIIATAYLTGTGAGPQFTYTPLTHSTVATGLGTPQGVAVDQAGNALVLDTNGHRLVKVTGSSGATAVLATGVTGVAGPALDGAGNVYYSTADPNHAGLFEVVRLVSTNGGSTYSGTAVVADSLTAPAGIAVDASGNVFVADSSTKQVTEYVNNAGYYLSRTVLSGLSGAVGVAVGADGSLFVATTGAVQKATLANGVYGTPTTITPAAATGSGVSLDGSGNVFVADAGFDRVLRLRATDYASTTLYTYNNSSVYGLGVTAAGDVLVGEPGTGTLGKLTLSTAPALTFASTAVGSTSTDSPQTITFFNTGNAALLTDTSGSSVSSNNSQFVLGSTSTCPAALGNSATFAQGASCTDLVSFQPNAAGSATGTLTTTYLVYNGGTATITDALSGTGTAGTPVVQAPVVSQPYGTNDTLLNATITYTGSTAPTGAVTYTVSTPTPITVTGQCDTASGGTRTCRGRPNLQATPAGTYQVNVTEAADANYAAATGVGSLTITKETPTASAIAVPSSVAYGASSITLMSYVGYNSYDAAGPTGNLNFVIDGNITVQAACTNANPRACQATYNPSALSVGTHTLTATEAADTNFNTASGSGSFTVTVGTPAGTVPATSVAYGASVVRLVANFAYSGASAPTGQVLIAVNGGAAQVATCTGSSSPRSCSVNYDPSGLAAGSYNVVATEAADGNYQTASATGMLTVGAAAPTVTVVNASANYGATTVQLQATIGFSGSTAPTGTVTFAVGSNGTTTGQCTTSGSSRNCTATYNPHTLPTGSTSVVVTEAADSNYSSSNGTGTLNIVPAQPTLTASAATATYGSTAVTLAATELYQGTAAPSGQTSFTVNGSTLVQAVCNAAASPQTCTGSFNPAALGAGRYNVGVSQAADANYSAPVGMGSTLTITQATPGVAVRNGTTPYGTATTAVSATVTYSGASAPTGAVTFAVDGGAAVTAACTGGSGTLTCTASVNTASLTVGTHTLAASVAADTNYAANSATGSLAVQPGAPVLAASNVTGTAGGSAVTLSATETFSGSTVPTGAVTFQANGTTLTGTCTGTASPRTCTASLDVSRLGSGTYNYTVSSAADSNYAAAGPATGTVTLSASTTTLTVQPVTSTYGVTPLTLTAQLTFTGTSAPTGATTLLIDGTTQVAASCTGTASPQTCTASYTGTALAAGTHTLGGTYAGDANYAASTANPTAAITITRATPGITVTSPSIAYGTASTTLNATVSYTGPVAPTGAVTFRIDNTTTVQAFCTSGTAVLNCAANFQSNALTVGSHTLVASIAADSNYAANSSSTGTITVTSATPVISLPTVLATYGTASVNLVATVSNLQPVAPTGALTFRVDGGTPFAANCSFSGSVRTCSATYSAASLSVGTHTLTATEDADANYTAATANSTLNVTRATPTVSAPPVSVPASSSTATLTATVAFSGGVAPSGGVTFTLAGSSPLPGVCTGSASPLSCSANISLRSVPAGSYNLTATVAGDGNYQAASATTTLTVASGAASTFPTCTLGAIKSVSSTSNTVSMTASCSDPGGLGLTTTINWGDGTPLSTAANNSTLTHTYAAPSTQTTYTAVLTGTNTAGNSGNAMQDVTVVPVIAVAPAGGASVTAAPAAQPTTVAALQVTFVCTSVSTNVSGASVTNALPSSYGITCSAPTVSSTSTGAAQVNIQTTRSGTAMLRSERANAIYAALLLPLFGLPLAALRGDALQRRRLLALLLLGLMVSSGLVGCGGSFRAPVTATPTGNYYITITEVPANGTTPPTGFVQTSLIVPLTVH